MPQTIHNLNNYIISLSDLTKWLSERAQEMGVDVFTGFAGDEVNLNHIKKIIFIIDFMCGEGKNAKILLKFIIFLVYAV